jgi:hypothetical protein
MTRFLILGLVALSLAGCSRIQNGIGSLGFGGAKANRSQVEVQGVRFHARASADKADKRDIAITVSPFAVDPEAALEAGRYQATRYCLLTYGGSDTVWTVGPDSPRESLPIDGDTVTLQGRCTQR